MSDNPNDFFEGIGSGVGSPTALLKTPGDMVHGEVVELFKRPYIPFGKKDPEKRDDGTDKQQLVIVLQTTNRNWANVNKVPKVDPNDENSPEKPPSEDDGKRAIYVPEGKNIQFAIGRAIGESQARFEVGGTLAVRITELKPTDKGNPLKVHEAKYSGKPASSGFFPSGGQAPAEAAPPAQQAPAQQQAAPPAQAPAQQAPPAQAAPPAQQDPWGTPAPAQQQAPASQDPWGTPAPAAGNGPPF